MTYEWNGGELLPKGAPFVGYEAFLLNKTSTEMATEYDTKIGYCICDEITGVCESYIDPEILGNGMNASWENANGAFNAALN